MARFLGASAPCSSSRFPIRASAKSCGITPLARSGWMGARARLAVNARQAGRTRTSSGAIPGAVALALGIAAAGGALWSMRPPGPGLDPDSMSYLAAADSLNRAGDLRVPFAEWSSRDSTERLRDFAPGFSVAIAALETASVSSERGATWVEAASAFATVAGSTLLVSAATTPAVGAAAAVAVLVTPALVEDHTIVLSEPLFLALLVTMLALAAAERPRASALGVVAAAAVLVRY